MAIPKIGLEAILNMTNFNKGLKSYTSGVATMEKQTGTAAKGLASFDDKIGGLSGGFMSLIPGIAGATAAFYGLGKVMEFGKEGATVAQTKDSFDRLMTSMGVAPDILQQMSDAALGTVDDMTLMSSTMTLLAGTSDELGKRMAESAPQLLEIAKAANKLNPTLGDTAFLYESLSRGIKRSSPLILDNLGLVIKVGEANQRWADSHDVVLENMTAEQKQLALLDAALESGTRMIEQAGGTVAAMGDDFAQTEVQIKNMTDQIKADTYPAIADLFAVISDVIGALDSFLGTYKKVKAEFLEKIPTGEGLFEYGPFADALDALEMAAGFLDDTTESTENLTGATGELSDTQHDASLTTEELAGEQHEASITTEELEDAQKRLEKAVQAVSKAYSSAFGELSKGIGDLRDLGKAAEKSAADYDKAVKDLNKTTAKSLKDVRDNFEATLPNRTTVEDRMGMAGDAWDEWGLRIQDIIENGVASPWYATLQEMGYAKPPDVGISGWAKDLQDEFYAGRLPDLLPEDWAEKVRQQQQEATAAVRAETAARRAELEKARQEELAAQEQARKDTLTEIALGMAEATGLLARWSEQRFGFAEVGDTANEVLRMIQTGAIEIDQGLQTIIGDMLAGVNKSFEETGRVVEENKAALDEVLDPAWVDQRRGTMATLGEVIYENTSNVFDPMLENFYGASTGIMSEAVAMGFGLDNQFGKVETDWTSTVNMLVDSMGDGATDIQKEWRDKVIKTLEQETPKQIVVTVTTEVDDGGTTYYGDTDGKQHGGRVPGSVPVMVGEGGPELFIPDQPGTVIPNWQMNVPALLGGVGGTTGGSTGAPIQITMNPVINNQMDLAEFQARTLQTVQQALRGA